MKRAVLLALVVLLLIFGAGFVFISFVTGSGAPVQPIETASHEQEPGERSAAVVTDAPAPLVEAKLLSAEGTVIANDASGNAMEVPVGQAFPFDVTLRTLDGTARVALAESVVELYEKSAVSFPAIDRIQLEEGRMRADVEEEGGNLRVAFAGSDAVATTDAGALFALTDGAGSVTVAAEEGTVRFDAGGESVEIQEGQESSVLLTGTPSAPRVPSSLFLRVRRPPRETRSRRTTITGQSIPGSLVRVAGATTAVDANGRFVAEVPLREGANVVTVETTSVRGEQESETHRVLVDSTAARIKSRVAW